MSILARDSTRQLILKRRYFVAFMLDTSVGVALTIGLHSLVLRAARKRAETNSFAATIFNCGNYGIPYTSSRLSTVPRPQNEA